MCFTNLTGVHNQNQPNQILTALTYQIQADVDDVSVGEDDQINRYDYSGGLTESNVLLDEKNKKEKK